MLQSLENLSIVFTNDVERAEIRRWIKAAQTDSIPDGYNLYELERLSSVLAEYKDKLVSCPYCGANVIVALQPQSQKLYVYCIQCGNAKLGLSSNIYARSYPDFETQIDLSSDFCTIRQQVEEMVERFNFFARGDITTIAGDITTVIDFIDNCKNTPSGLALMNASCPKCSKKIYCHITEYGFATLVCHNCGFESDKVYLGDISKSFFRDRNLVEIFVRLLEKAHTVSR